MTMHSHSFPDPVRRRPSRSTSCAHRRHGPEPGLRLDLMLTRSGPRLTLAGELDLASVGHFDLWLIRLEQLLRPVALDLSRVRFADSHGIGPLLDSALRRRQASKPPVLLLASSAAVDRVLRALAGDDGVRALVRRSHDGGETALRAGARRRLTATIPLDVVGPATAGSSDDELTHASNQRRIVTDLHDRGTA